MVTLVEPRTKPKVTGMPVTGLALFVGHPKSGKSWLAANAPDSIVIMLEKAGGDRIPFGRIQEINCDEDNALEQFAEVMDAVMADDSIKIIVIDSVDQWAKLIQADIAKGAGIEHIQKPKPGVDSRSLWGEFGYRVHTLTDALKGCGKLVILIAHCKPPEKDNDGRVITPAGINISGKGGAYIAAQAEMIGFVGVRVLAGKAQHYITFKAPSDIAIWRTRVDELHDTEIVLDKKNPWQSLIGVFNPVKPVKKGGKK